MNIYEIIEYMKPNWHSYKIENNLKSLDAFDKEFPNDYLIFLKEMGEGSYQFDDILFSFWSVSSVIKENKNYKIDDYLNSKLIGIGTDGGSICFLLDYRDFEKIKFSSVSLGDIDIDEINILANSFTSALNLMLNGKIGLDDIL